MLMTVAAEHGQGGVLEGGQRPHHLPLPLISGPTPAAAAAAAAFSLKCCGCYYCCCVGGSFIPVLVYYPKRYCYRDVISPLSCHRTADVTVGFEKLRFVLVPSSLSL